MSPSVSKSAPLNLQFDKSYNSIPEIGNFKYWYGDIKYGLVVYIGTVDLSGFETELQIFFSNKKIEKILVILGPAGINDHNCISSYRKVEKVLNEKYGHYRNRKIEKDTLVHDLFWTSVCTPVRNELYVVSTYWQYNHFNILAKLIGDDFGFYIEIEYSHKNLKNRKLRELKRSL